MSTVAVRRGAWERFAPLTGLLAVVLWVVGVGLMESAGTPSEDEGAQLLVEHYDENSGVILAGAFLFMLGSVAFLWFLGSLRARFFQAEGGIARLTAVVFATGIVTAVMAIGFAAPEAAAGFAAQEIDPGLEPGAAQAMNILGDGFFIAGEAAVVGFFLAVGLAALRTRALPVWLAWASIVLGIAAVFPWIGWAVFIWGLPLWVIIAGVWLFLRGEDRTTETQTLAV
jgi:hypothetical protein